MSKDKDDELNPNYKDGKDTYMYKEGESVLIKASEVKDYQKKGWHDSPAKG